jgi:hypothetical protein
MLYNLVSKSQIIFTQSGVLNNIKSGFAFNSYGALITSTEILLKGNTNHQTTNDLIRVIANRLNFAILKYRLYRYGHLLGCLCFSYCPAYRSCSCSLSRLAAVSRCCNSYIGVPDFTNTSDTITQSVCKLINRGFHSFGSAYLLIVPLFNHNIYYTFFNQCLKLF